MENTENTKELTISPLAVLIKDSGVDKQTALTVISSLDEFLTSIEQKRERAKSFKIEGVSDIGGMKMAREGRLDVKNNRLDALKIVKTKRAEVQEKMSIFTKEDKLWLKASQLIEEKSKEVELILKEKEDFAIKEKEREDAERLTQRLEEIKPFIVAAEFLPSNFELMPEELWQQYVTDTKKNDDERKEEIAKKEAERIRLEELDKLDHFRRSETAIYAQFIENYSDLFLGDLLPIEYTVLLSDAKAKKKISDDAQEAIRLENEKLKLEQEATRLENERIQKEKEAKEKERNDLQKKRLNELLPYNTYGESVDMPTLWSLSEDKYQDILKSKKKLFDIEQERSVKAEQEAIRLRQAEQARKDKEIKDEANKQEELKLQSQAPDKAKLEQLLTDIESIKCPELSDPTMDKISKDVFGLLDRTAKYLTDKINSI